MGHSGDGGKLIHKKTRSKKSRDTVPLRHDLDHASRNNNMTGVLSILYK
jgi:hypothetical protein